MLPRIPLAQDFLVFNQAGCDLAHWHINYETTASFELTESVLLLETDDLYRVQMNISYRSTNLGLYSASLN